MRRPMVSGLALAAAVATVVGGCTSSPDPEPRPAARAFAQGLASGNLVGVGFADRSGVQAQRWWRTVRQGMGEAKPRVRVLDLQQTGDAAATARLGFRWDLPRASQSWAYRTSVGLAQRQDGTWAVRLSPASVVPGLKAGERLEKESVPAERADILGAGGAALVTDRRVVRFGIDKTRVKPRQQAASARQLAALLGIDEGSYAARVRSAGDAAFVEALVLRTQDVTPSIRSGYRSIQGARALRDQIPLAPTREFARALLGTVGPVTAEMVADSDGAYQSGDVAGIGGLEQRYDKRLRGAPGVVVQAVTPGNDDARVLWRAAPRRGKPLRTTLDADLQQKAERALAGVGPASALVALRPSTGEVLVAAEGPGSKGYPTATVGRYAPGSTFKVVSSLALLRSGLTGDSRVTCAPAVVVDGKRFHNYSDYPASALGRITLEDAVAHSCNTAFISQHDRVTQQDLSDAAAALGLGVDHDIGFPAFFGSVPAQASTTEHAADLIGQGKVLASPLAMATVTASVAAGHTVVPRLLAGTDQDAAPTQPLTRQEARSLRGLMTAVVNRGSGALLADLPGPPVLAKTGTAEFGDTRPLRTHAWMIAAQGDLAVAVFVDVGQSGSGTAGPVLERFLREAR